MEKPHFVSKLQLRFSQNLKLKAVFRLFHNRLDSEISNLHISANLAVWIANISIALWKSDQKINQYYQTNFKQTYQNNPFVSNINTYCNQTNSSSSYHLSPPRGSRYLAACSTQQRATLAQVGKSSTIPKH